MTYEKLTAAGSVQINVIDVNTGQILQTETDKNLVVNLGRENVAKLIGGDPIGAAVTKIAFGDNDTPPNLEDTAITNPFTKAIDSVAYPAPNKVQFSFSLGETEANGLNIYELGLITSENSLFSRKTRALIAKDSSVIITGIWTITIN